MNDMQVKKIITPVDRNVIDTLEVGDLVEISGMILCGRDAVLPKVVKMIEEGTVRNLGVDLEGQAVFHTAVSPAGVGPTSSNKVEIESSIIPLSRAGVCIHLGKGKLSDDTIAKLEENHAVYAVIPPVTALLGERTSEIRTIAFEELGMEALFLLKADRFPAVIAAAKGRSIYDGL